MDVEVDDQEEALLLLLLLSISDAGAGAVREEVVEGSLDSSDWPLILSLMAAESSMVLPELLG